MSLSKPAFLSRYVLATAALLGALLAAEVAFRLKSPVGWEFLLTDTPSLYDLSIFAPDDELGMVLRPNSVATNRTPEFHTTVQINSLGVRGEVLPEKEPGEFRILAVGDSFTLGLQVDIEKTFAEQTGALLSERLGHRVRLLNAGVDGFGTKAATTLMQRLVGPTQADAVLLTFFLGNDFWDNTNFEQVRSQTPLIQKGRNPLSETVGGFSALYSYGKMAWSLRQLANDPDVAGRRRPELAIFNDKEALGAELPATRAALAEFVAECKTLGVEPYLVLAPPAYAVQTQRAQATLEMFGLDPSTLDLDAPAAAVAQAAPAGLPIVDLGPTLRSHSNPQALYFTLDGHWTEEGHNTAAATIADFLFPFLSTP